jgi:hypothetical protein
MNILLIGNICSGKSTVRSEIVRLVNKIGLNQCAGYAIDEYRNTYGNGRFSGEFEAWSRFLERAEWYSDKKNEMCGVFEFSGTGRNSWFMKEISNKSVKPWSIICCCAPKNVLIERYEKRGNRVNIPYDLNDIESSTKYMSDKLKTDYQNNYWNLPYHILNTNQEIDKIKSGINDIVQEIFKDKDAN